MRNILSIVLLVSLSIPILWGCKSTSAPQDEHYEEFVFIDSVHIHPAGISYNEGDSSQDRILKFYAEDGFIVHYEEITDTVTTHSFYDYTYYPDSIIKHTQIDTIQLDEWYSVYELNENRNIKKLVQHLFDVIIETEYSYDMEDHLAMIYFGSSDQHCKWLWRDGNLDKIVWGDGEAFTHFRYNDNTSIPFGSCFVQLPKLDVALSMMGFYGNNPINAHVIEAEESEGELTDVSIFTYDPGENKLSSRQMCYKGIETDSIECSIRWSTIRVRQ